MNDPIDTVLPHHQAAAGMWSAGGTAYDEISFAISDALAHAAQRLSPKPGEAVLDVATGTGWSARNAARTGARVVAVDIADELLKAAEQLSAHVQPRIEFRRADAERLPFEAGRFDRVISTFGVMFAANQAQAAAELGRVCRPGGRLVLATWVPGGAAERFFAVLTPYSEAPPPASPLAWGDPEHVERLLGRDFELKFEPGVNHAYYDDEAAIWDKFAHGFGPVRGLLNGLDRDRREALRRDVDAYHSQFRTEVGLHVQREYLVTVGRRR